MYIRLLQSLVIYYFVGYCNIACNGIGEYISLLHHRACLAAPKVWIQHCQWCVAYLDVATVGGIEPEQQFYECGFSATACAYDGCYFMLMILAMSY